MIDKDKLVLPRYVDCVEFERPKGLPETCSDADLLDAVKASLCGATHEELARLLGVPEIGVRYWLASPEWTKIKDHVWPELKGVVHTELCGIRSELIVQLVDRVRNGDPVYSAAGKELFRRKVKARDLATMLVQSTDVIHELEREIGKFTDPEGRMELADLQKALRYYAQQQGPLDITPNVERVQ